MRLRTRKDRGGIRGGKGKGTSALPGNCLPLRQPHFHWTPSKALCTYSEGVYDPQSIYIENTPTKIQKRILCQFPKAQVGLWKRALTNVSLSEIPCGTPEMHFPSSVYPNLSREASMCKATFSPPPPCVGPSLGKMCFAPSGQPPPPYFRMGKALSPLCTPIY